jgi:hypothetical protein
VRDLPSGCALALQNKASRLEICARFEIRSESLGYQKLMIQEPQSASVGIGYAEQVSISMPDHSVHKALDLAGDERLLVERWLGRTLPDDETISVNA